MCIIASVPKGMLLTEAQLEEMWSRNSDGGGISYFKDGKIETEKSMDRKKFIASVLKIQKKYGNRDILVHMRIKTHGSVCIENNHPFQVNKNTVMAHNGILPEAFIPPVKSDLSDTRFFIEYFMKYMPISKLDDPYFIDMVDEMINRGYGNKLVFMTTANTKYDSYIIGEYHGTWHEGIWFSNDSFKKQKWFGRSHNDGGLTRIGSTVYNVVDDSCSTSSEFDKTEEIDASDPRHVTDWMVWNPEVWREFQEHGIQNIEEMQKDLRVKMTWDGLVCIDCGNKVEGIYGRYCEYNCESIDIVLDWCYANLQMEPEDIDEMMYLGGVEVEHEYEAFVDSQDTEEVLVEQMTLSEKPKPKKAKGNSKKKKKANTKK